MSASSQPASRPDTICGDYVLPRSSAVRHEVTQAVPLVAGAFVQAGEVVMRIGQSRVRIERFAIGGGGFRLAAEVLEQDAQIEEQGAIDLPGLAVDALGFGNRPAMCSSRPQLMRASM